MATQIPPDAHDQQIGHLLEEARHGSGTAIGSLFESARAYLLFLANKEMPRGLQAKFGASDLVQETAIEAHRDFRRFAGSTPEEFYAWLRSILQNNLRDAVRRYELSQKRDVAKETSLASLAHRHGDGQTLPSWPPDRSRPPDGSIIRREDAATVEAVIARLPDDYRIVLRMRYWDDLSFQQIGDRFGRSPEAVRKLWYRAVQKLQDELRSTDDATRIHDRKP
jgi:RNA polymerase sigma-70 factor (ECF subfamily)